MTIKLEPTKELVKNWIENFVPVKDLFFVEEKALAPLADHLSEVLVIPRKEFFEHSSYNQIQLVTSNRASPFCTTCCAKAVKFKTLG